MTKTRETTASLRAQLPAASSLEFCLRTVHSRLSPCFARAEPRMRALNYMFGLANIVKKPSAGRRNIATYESEYRADGAQRLLTTARWDDAEVRRKLREMARAAAAEGGDFYITEATFAKKGNRAVAVDLQFSSENGRAQNCQNAVALLYVSPDRKVFLLDIDLYLPPAWSENERLRKQGNIPPEVRHRSKSAIASDMIQRAIADDFRPRRIYLSLNCPNKLRLLMLLQQQQIPHLTWLTSAELGQLEEPVVTDARAVAGARTELTARQMPRQRMSPMAVTLTPSPAYAATGKRGSTSYFRACMHHPLSPNGMGHAMAEMRHLDRRWRAIRTRSQLDRYEVRGWVGWHRHMTLAMAVQFASELTEEPVPVG
nr:transposase [Kibdelosporangium sp. MJ126-NF4]CTQ97166.1 Mobile element protein [Kibdelosporangium sp. MJ126-NF4]